MSKTPIFEGQDIRSMKPSQYKYVKAAKGGHIFLNENGEKEVFARHKYPIAGWQLRMGNLFFEFCSSLAMAEA